MGRFLIFVLVFGTIGSGALLARGKQDCSLPYRLPNHVQPKHYELHIEPSLEELKFKGHVQIDLSVDESKRDKSESSLDSNQILIHADRGIKFDESSIKFVLVENRKVEIISICHDSKVQQVRITLAEQFPNQLVEARLFVSFFGALRDDMFGFYKSTYFSEDKSKHFLATTQFEATEARKAFPCFDEPSFKATFNVTIVHEPGVIALSNTEVIEEKTMEDGRTMVKFARTPPMSTYLLAYVVGEFEYIERVILGGRLRVRVYGTPGESHKGQFALDTACRAIQLMEEYFGIEFPLNKMDLIGIPDFDAGAMENWGLITFREMMLQVDERYSTPLEIAEVGITVVHELAHQWFGNLVTMRWWNDLWLNEGFATWMSYHILKQVHPQFDVKNIFLMENQIPALLEDAEIGTHAIRPTELIATNNQIEALVDTITYQKSASLISFIHDDYLGPELFKESLRHYMEKHKYGNTITDDLCHSMEEASKLPVQPILDSWTAQPGYPILHVDYQLKNTVLTINQNRFMTNSNLVRGSDTKQKWLIPVSMVVVAPGREEILKFTIDGKERQTTVRLPDWFEAGKQGHWLKLNHDFTGLYRVEYPSKLLNLLKEPIKSRIMAPADRLNILDDAKALWSANVISIYQYIELLSWFVNENHGVVLTGLVQSLENLKLYAKSAISDQDCAPKVHTLMVKLLGHHLKHPIFTTPTAKIDQIDEHGLAMVMNLLVSIDNKQASTMALKLFSESNGEVTKIRVALREAVYVAVARSGSDEQHEQLVELLFRTRSRSERNRLIMALPKSQHLHRQRRLAALLKTSFHALKVDPSLNYILHTMVNSVPNTVLNDFFPSKLVEEERIKEKKKNSKYFKLIAKTAMKSFNKLNKRLISGPLKALRDLFNKKVTDLTAFEKAIDKSLELLT